MTEQKCQNLLHLFRLIVKPTVQAVVNYISFCHTCLHKIQRRTNVPAIRQSEQYKRHRPETTLLFQLVEHGFLRVKCGDCKHEKIVAFSCKRRGFCPSCGARRMAESAALLVDDVLRGYPVRQWVLSLPIPLRLLLARNPSVLSNVMAIIHRAISTHIVNKAGFTIKQAKTGAVTLIQRFGSALNLNIHFHMLFLEGAISDNPWG